MSGRKVRVRVPEMNIGPPLARFKREHEVLVDIGQAETMVAELGAEILDAEPAAELPTDWPLKSKSPADYIAEYGDTPEDELSPSVAANLELARKLVSE